MEVKGVTHATLGFWRFTRSQHPHLQLYAAIQASPSLKTNCLGNLALLRLLFLPKSVVCQSRGCILRQNCWGSIWKHI